MGRRGQLNRRLEVSVESVGPDGLGRGIGTAESSLDPVSVRLAGVLPGESVAADVHHIRKDGVHFARVAEVHRASEARVEPGCAHFLRCGGCDLLHADIEWQRTWKRQRVADALGRPLDEVAPTVASPHAEGYRSLVKLVRGPQARLGSYAPRSHHVVDMTGCRIHAPVAERIADRARAVLARAPTTAFRYLLIRSSSTEARAVVTVVVRSADESQIGGFVDALVEMPSVAQVRLHTNDDPGDALLTGRADRIVYDDGSPVVEGAGPVAYNLAAGAFAQVNPAAAARLYDCVVQSLRPNGQRVLDLYSGSGGIALTLLAAGAEHVTAVETTASAVEAAIASAEAAGWTARFAAQVATAEAALESAPEQHLIVVNPPRKGLSPEVARALADYRWRRLVYVSCNPDSLARDVAMIGAPVVSVVPVDLFPQTRHVETVLTFARDDAD